jgi:glycosyltransferase involved in cell wall biosynthesis
LGAFVKDFEVFVSMRNEENNIEGFCFDLLTACEQLGRFSITVIDNNSEDSSIKNLQKLIDSNKISVIKLDQDIGYTGSIDLAIKSSRSNATVIVDGDGQFSANYIKDFLVQIRNGHDLVLPVRTNLIGSVIRRFASRVLVLLCKKMLGFAGPDINGGIRALSRNFINQYISIGQGFRLANPALFYQARMQNLSLSFVTVTPKNRNSGASFIPWGKPWQLFIESVREIRMIRRRFYV